MLINQIVNENYKQQQDEQKKEFENKIVNIDADSEPHASSVVKGDEKDEKGDVEMKVDEKNECKSEDKKGAENDQ